MYKRWLYCCAVIFGCSITSISYAQVGYEVLSFDNPGALDIRKYGSYTTTNIPFVINVTPATPANEGYLHIQYPDVAKPLKSTAYSRLVSLNLTSNEQGMSWVSQNANNIIFYARSSGHVNLRLRIRLYHQHNSSDYILRGRKWADYEAAFSLDGMDWKNIIIPIGKFKDKHGASLTLSATAKSRITLEVIRKYKKNNTYGSVDVDIKPISIVPEAAVNLFDFEIASNSRNQGLFFGNESTGFNFRFQVHDPTNINLKNIRVEIQDAHKGSLPFYSSVLAVPIKSNKEAFNIPFEFNRDILPANGVYMLTATALTNKNIALTKTSNFAILGFNEEEASSSLFGYQSSLAPTFMANKSLIKINQETDWYNIEPVEGRYIYNQINNLMNLYQSQNVSYLASLKYPPTWLDGCNKKKNAHKNTCGFFSKELPKNIESWNKYIDAVAKKYSGKIKYYEFWNEPNAKTHYSGNMTDLVNGLKETRRVLKTIFPDSQIVAPAVSGIPYKWLDKFGDAGGFKYTDVISIHNYMHNRDLKDLSKRIARLRKLLKSHGKGDAPIWDSESAYISAPRVDGRIMSERDVFYKKNKEDKKLSRGNDLLVSWVKRAYTEDEVAENIVKQYIISFGEGLSKIIYFARGYWDLFDMGHIKMQGLAYLNLKYMMSDITLQDVQKVTINDDKKIQIYKFRRKNIANNRKKELYVLWHWQKGVESYISIKHQGINAEIHLSDIYGNDIQIDSDGKYQTINITDSPIYIETAEPIQFITR